jgi:hypothetical protein
VAFLGLNVIEAESPDAKHFRAVVALMRELGVKEYKDRDGQTIVLEDAKKTEKPR